MYSYLIYVFEYACTINAMTSFSDEFGFRTGDKNVRLWLGVGM